MNLLVKCARQVSTRVFAKNTRTHCFRSRHNVSSLSEKLTNTPQTSDGLKKPQTPRCCPYRDTDYTGVVCTPSEYTSLHQKHKSTLLQVQAECFHLRPRTYRDTDLRRTEEIQALAMPFIQGHEFARKVCTPSEYTSLHQKHKSTLLQVQAGCFHLRPRNLPIHKPKTGGRNPRPHHAVNTETWITLVRCAHQASTRVHIKKQEHIGSGPDTMCSCSSEKLTNTQT